MSFEPQKFYIGLIDFFSILLPGAIVTYLIRDTAWHWIMGSSSRLPEGAEGGMVFFLSAYLLGHFAFLLGSHLDDIIYDPVRKATYRGQVELLAAGKRMSPGLYRKIAALIFKINPDAAVASAVRIKAQHLSSIGTGEEVRAFQWCKARLNLEHPEALASVERFEADSKFFRSLSVVLILLTLVSPFYSLWGIAAVGLVFLPMSLWRYMDQRFKATNQAFWFIITLEGERGAAAVAAGGRRPAGTTHAGGVVYRKRGHRVEYLLVQASKEPGHWVLPKGHIEPDENERETAVREVHEESGVWGILREDLTTILYTKNRRRIRVRFYLMEAVREEMAAEQRAHEWLPVEKAVLRATHDDTKRILKLAEQKRSTA